VTETAFFARTYEEALALAVDARDHMAHARVPPDLEDRKVETVAGLRLVARVTHMMAWLLDQRAVHAGEIDAGEAVRRAAPLAEHAVCLDEDDAFRLNPGLAALMARSRKLYVRVARLDELARRNAA